MRSKVSEMWQLRETKAAGLTESPVPPVNKHPLQVSGLSTIFTALEYCWHRYLKIATNLYSAAFGNIFYLSSSSYCLIAYISPAVQLPCLQRCIGKKWSKNKRAPSIPFPPRYNGQKLSRNKRAPLLLFAQRCIGKKWQKKERAPCMIKVLKSLYFVTS